MTETVDKAGTTPGTDLTERRGVRFAAGVLLPVLLLVVWQWVSTSGLVAVSILPSPAMVWLAAVDLTERGLYAHYIAISTQRVLMGFAIGAAVGLAVGAVVGLSQGRQCAARTDVRRYPRRPVAGLGAAADPVVRHR